MDKIDLELITELVRVNQPNALSDSKIKKAAEEAIADKTFSKMERLARMMKRHHEEEQFLMLATKIILEQ